VGGRRGSENGSCGVTLAALSSSRAFGGGGGRSLTAGCGGREGGIEGEREKESEHKSGGMAVAALSSSSRALGGGGGCSLTAGCGGREGGIEGERSVRHRYDR